MLHAIHAVLDCDAGFFDAFTGPIMSNERWGADLMKLIEKKRKIKDRKEKERIVMAEQMSDDEDGSPKGNDTTKKQFSNFFKKGGSRK